MAGTNGATLEQALKHSDSQKITVSQLRSTLERQEYKCALTGRILNPETASIDHIAPLHLGGTNTLGNIHIVHKAINFAKGSMTMVEFIAMCREVVSYCDKHNVEDSK